MNFAPVRPIGAVASTVSAVTLTAAILLSQPASLPAAAPTDPPPKSHPAAANDLVDWQAWSPEIFAKAEAENKLVFVSIGDSSTHWCAKLHRTSFADEKIAAALNRNFICVKVHRLVRPDIDLTFRAYAMAINANVGWPIGVWLTPVGSPVKIGNFSGLNKLKSPKTHFMKSIEQITELWQQHPKYLGEQSVRDILKITTTLQRKPFSKFDAPDPAATRESFLSSISTIFDPISGGFGINVKLPRLETIEALLASLRVAPVANFHIKQAKRMLTGTLDGILAGALIDPLDGGMFRHAHESRWRSPTFERVLIDQARFATVLLNAYQQTGDASYAHAATRMLAFCRNSLGADNGSYYSTLAEDSAPHEGAPADLGLYYLWKGEALASLLDDDEFAATAAALGIKRNGNVTSTSKLKGIDHNNNILYAKSPDAHAPTAGSPLASAIEKMMTARAKRPPPFRDELVITGWNGLMIGSLARASEILGEPAYLARARATAKIITERLFDREKGQLARGMSGDRILGPAYSEDYIFLARGLIDLYRAGGDPQHLQTALHLQKIADEKFFASSVGLYHFTPPSDIVDVPLRLWTLRDTDMPSVNGIAAHNQLDLATIDDSPDRREKTSAVFRAASVDLAAHPLVNATLVGAILQSATVPTQAIVSGRASDPVTEQLLAAARRHTPPNTAVLFMDGGANEQTLIAMRPALARFKTTDGEAKLFLCRDLEPGAPITDPAAVAIALAGEPTSPKDR